MKWIVHENYAGADLPTNAAEKEIDLFEMALTPPERVMSLDELFAMRRPPYRTAEEIVADVRQQREEWDD